MTARQIFEATLIELSKVQAPALKLYEFNYLFNKAINQYINKVYNIYDVNQQTADDLRVLKSTAYLTPTKMFADNKAIRNYGTQGGTLTGSITNTWTDNDGVLWEVITQHNNNSKTITTKKNQVIVNTVTETVPSGFSGESTSYLSNSGRKSIQSLHGATYEVTLPMDYLHILNCICIYYVAKQKDCWDAGTYIEIPASRLTADSWGQILTDVYNRPSPMKPYYYIHNYNKSNNLPTNDISTEGGTDLGTTYNVSTYNSATGSNFSRTFKLNNQDQSVVEKPIASRIGNASTVRCEIRYGKDDTVFQLAEVQIDYIKVPQHIRLTQEQIDLTEDTSQIMEFPDYVNQEIINELVHLVMERTSDPRLNTNMQITQSIARPTGQQ